MEISFVLSCKLNYYCFLLLFLNIYIFIHVVTLKQYIQYVRVFTAIIKYGNVIRKCKYVPKDGGKFQIVFICNQKN